MAEAAAKIQKELAEKREQDKKVKEGVSGKMTKRSGSADPSSGRVTRSKTSSVFLEEKKREQSGSPVKRRGS